MADADESKKGLPMKIIGIGLVVGLLSGGAVFFFLNKGGPENRDGAVEAAINEEEEEEEEEGVEGGGAIFALEPFIVNLADTQDLRYLKITIKLDLLRPRYVEDLANNIPQIRDTLLILLSSKDSSSIRTVEGKMELRDEILHRVNRVFEENKVKTAYYTDFVMQ